jgi:hypothetical protein
MTQTQANQLVRAITRATEYGIEVVAKGRRKVDNARIFCTTSHSDPDRWHVVAVVGNRLVCDCRSHVICTHRAAVHMELSVEVAKRTAQSDMIERALIEEARTRDRAVLHRSNAPISIFK